MIRRFVALSALSALAAASLAACGAATEVPLDTGSTALGPEDAAAGTPDATDSLVSVIPLQTYAGCTSDTLASTSNSSTSSGGSGSVTLAERGGVITATLDIALLGSPSLTFQSIAPTAASATPGQSFSPTTITSAGPGGDGTITLPVSVGALSLVGDELFVSVFNDASGSAGFVSCPVTDPPTSTLPANPSASIPSTAFGECATSVEFGGSSTGGSSSATLAMSEGTLTVTFGASSILSGMLEFAVTTDGTATLTSATSATIDTFACTDSGGGLPVPTVQRLTSSSGLLVTDGSGAVINLVLTTATCAGTVSIACGARG